MKQTITHIALVVRDYDEAIAFYTQKLNFILIEDTYQPEQDKRWVVVAPPRIFRYFNSIGKSFHIRTRKIHRKSNRRKSILVFKYR